MTDSQITADEKLELAIKQAGAKVQDLHMRGRNADARLAFEEVKKLVAQRSPEQVARMEQQRDLERIDQIERQREDAQQESLREF